MVFKRTMRHAGIFLLLGMTWVTTCTAACNSGILRMKAFPAAPAIYDSCYAGPIPTRNSIKALCNVAVKVTVNGAGIVKWDPIVKGSYGYGSVYGSIGPFNTAVSMNCKDHNASGLFQTASKSAATLMFYDNVGRQLSNLTKTSATKVSLSPGVTYANQGPGSPCTYTYTVVSGCVLGAKPPPKVPACPAGYILKTGASSIKYCAPCPAGTSSPGPDSSSCTPCPAGTYNPNYGNSCRECPGYGYAPKAGATECVPCLLQEGTTWSDGKRCASCPAGSFSSPAVKSQCIKCTAGKKCCTVNWTPDSGSCPKCTAASGPTAPPLTSIFALASASPASCLASNYALCTPKFKITINGKCSITLSNTGYASKLDEFQNCDWRTYQTVPIRGTKVNALVDLAQLPLLDYIENWLLGNLTAAGSGTLTFRDPSRKCNLTYRALTPPAAALLGVPPKPCALGTPGCPSTSNTCPPGSYLETASAARPAPCILCPPGTYSSKASSNAPCTPCPPGTFSKEYGSTTCRKCAAGVVASTARSAACTPCGWRGYPSSASTCTKCPNNTGMYYTYQTTCVGGDAYGSICCAAGKCSGQPRCPGSLPGNGERYPAVMQLVKKSLRLPACKAATILSCLPDKALVELQPGAGYLMSLSLSLLQAPKCVDPKPYGQPYRLAGAYLTAKRAYVQGQTSAYVLVSEKAKGTITMYPSKDFDILNVPDSPPFTQSCSATFKLVAGHAFDLAPPAGAKCPSNAIPSTVDGRALCEFCDWGSYKTASGVCASCPAGTFQNLRGATACKPCPAGSVCPAAGSTVPQPCSPGSYSAKVGSTASSCTPCPKNTFATGSEAKSCTKCPSLTTSRPGSSSCGVFW